MSEYWRRVVDAVVARAPAPTKPAAEGVACEDVELRARVSALEMDLHEKDRTIQTMRQEYAALQSADARSAAVVGQDHLERLFKRLAGPLSNLSALAQFSARGKDVSVTDLVSLFHAVEKELARAGMERVGSSGDDVPFDATVHQRMSGGPVHERTLVTIRVPGYRFGDRVIIKAMVSSVEKHDG